MSCWEIESIRFT